MGSNGPHISVCTNCSGAFALHVSPTGNDSRACLPSTQPSHTWRVASIWGRPRTIPPLDSNFRPLKLRWPNRRCHFHDSSSITPMLQLPIFVFKFNGNIRFFDIRTRAISFLLAFLRVRSMFSICIMYPFWSS